MANVADAYCALTDLRTGDLAPPSYQTKEQYIKLAAEEIEAALGHVYVTPFVIASSNENRPTILILKKLNWLIASGRFILDVAAVGEQDNLNAYGKRMLDEAYAILKRLANLDPILVGAELIDNGDDGDSVTGPMIHNEDDTSLVGDFYKDFTTIGYGPRPRRLI